MKGAGNPSGVAFLGRRSCYSAAVTLSIEPRSDAVAAERDELLRAFRETRELSAALCGPLEAEDYRIQSMPDVSPPWWNLGHTSWFFAKNILEPRGLATDQDRALEFVLNSYYEALGPRVARVDRGLLTRPTTAEVFAYRRSVDARLTALLGEAGEAELAALAPLVTAGIHHEQQHQELLVTEVKHILSVNPPGLRSTYRKPRPSEAGTERPGRFVPFAGGVFGFGNVEGGWCWDNELPVHKGYLADFQLFDRLVTNREYLEFIDDGGYRQPLLWLSNGWEAVRQGGWSAPLYWERRDGEWTCWTLGGELPLDPAAPVAHVSFYEAEAFARWKSGLGGPWAGCRLPTEFEWEQAARRSGFGAGNFLESGRLQPAPAAADPEVTVAQLAGDAWEWTTSHYEAYPGFEPFAGNLQEYNGKFMDNQRVLRGGSCATPRSHIRVSYRNFWPAATRFQFTGLRLARLD